MATNVPDHPRKISSRLYGNWLVRPCAGRHRHITASFDENPSYHHRLYESFHHAILFGISPSRVPAYFQNVQSRSHPKGAPYNAVCSLPLGIEQSPVGLAGGAYGEGSINMERRKHNDGLRRLCDQATDILAQWFNICFHPALGQTGHPRSRSCRRRFDGNRMPKTFG